MTRPDRDVDVEQSRTAEIIAEAVAADADTETKLARLHEMAAMRREDPVLKQHYESLRDAIAPQLRAEGPRYFIGQDGVKRYAYTTTPETLEVDIDEFVRLHEAGEMPEVDLDKVMPRKPDREALRRAIASRSKTHRLPGGEKDGKIPMRVVAKTMRYVPGTARVNFASEQDETDDG
jgi:hypothetical protein